MEEREDGIDHFNCNVTLNQSEDISLKIEEKEWELFKQLHTAFKNSKVTFSNNQIQNVPRYIGIIHSKLCKLRSLKAKTIKNYLNQKLLMKHYAKRNWIFLVLDSRHKTFTFDKTNWRKEYFNTENRRNI